MSILANLHLQSNIKINFNGGNLSSDTGLLLIHEFINENPNPPAMLGRIE